MSESSASGHRWFDLRRYSVDAKYPQTTTIEHTFSTYTYSNYEYHRQYTYYYKLTTNDDAMTLNIPYSVREFQSSIGSNSRPSRKPFKTEESDGSEGSEE